MANPTPPPKASHPSYASTAIKSDTDQQVWLGNPHVDNLMTMMVALSSEVWASRQRMAIMEKVLAAKGVAVTEAVARYSPSPDEYAGWEAERQAMAERIFKLTDNLLPHPTPEALNIARGLSRGGMQPTSVAYRMARHVALILAVRARQDRGESLSDVKSQMSEHPFVLQKAFETARDTDPNSLEAALRAIRDYEWEVKSGQIGAELGLDVLLARM